ncbi:MAG: ATP-dependent zinc metalloprotease FtsH [Patescibacteria group bacterium]
MKNLFKNFIIFFLIFLVVAGILSTYSASLDKPTSISIAKLIEQIENDEVQEIILRGEEINVTLKSGEEQVTRKESTDSFSTLLKNYEVAPEKIRGVNVTVEENTGLAFWLGTILPFLLPFLLIGVFIYIMFRQVQGTNQRAMSFGQSKARETSAKDKNKVTFKDVAGVKEAKEELKEVVDFLKHPRKFISLGAKIPKGVMLVGAPGTGKTLLARAVAGEASVPFYHISGSEFVEMFVGVGASRVRDLFKKAKKNTPCIVFVDEIDAVGRQRGAGLGGSHDEREQTLNQILVELDGFDTDTRVIVIAATNRPDILDQALLRPGRFDRRVVLDPPDINDREGILKVHAKEKPLDKDVNIRILAERTPGFTGADLANLLNESAILAARRNKKYIGMEDCLESIEKVLLGPERKSRLLSKKEKLITAYHEAGHALVAHILPHIDPVRKVSVISRGQAAGYTLKLPKEDKRLSTKTEFLEELSVLLAGHAAEKEIFNEITTGATYDLRQATKLARKLVTDFGMSDKLGPRTFGEREELIFLGREIHEERDYSDKVAQQIDSEISMFIDNAYSKARSVITKAKPMLKKIADTLVKQETLEQEEFVALFKKSSAKA